jgi:hypothetical protein
MSNFLMHFTEVSTSYDDEALVRRAAMRRIYVKLDTKLYDVVHSTSTPRLGYLPTLTETIK